MVGRLHLHVSFLNYLLYSRGIHWYGSPYLPLGRLLCGIRGHLGPLARIAQGDSGAPVARFPHKKKLRSHLLPPSLRLRVFP